MVLLGAYEQLANAGLDANVEAETTCFQFSDFDSAWDALAGVTTAALDPIVLDQAKSAVRKRMWTATHETREFRNETQFIMGHKLR